MLQHTATHCNTLPHRVATHCNTLQHTATLRSSLPAASRAEGRATVGNLLFPSSLRLDPTLCVCVCAYVCMRKCKIVCIQVTPNSYATWLIQTPNSYATWRLTHMRHDSFKFAANLLCASSRTKIFLEKSGCRTRQPGRTWLLGPRACSGTNPKYPFCSD